MAKELEVDLNMKYIRENFEKFLVGIRCVQDQKCVQGHSKVSELHPTANWVIRLLSSKVS